MQRSNLKTLQELGVVMEAVADLMEVEDFAVEAARH